MQARVGTQSECTFEKACITNDMQAGRRASQAPSGLSE